MGIADCLTVEPGYYLLSACVGGAPMGVGENTVVAPCSSPEMGTYVTETCVPEDTVFTPCKSCDPDTEIIVSACSAGAYDMLGADTVCAPCGKLSGEGCGEDDECCSGECSCVTTFARGAKS